MRAKEYIYKHSKEIKYIEILEQVIYDLLPLRLDRIATGEYVNNYLSADKKYQHYILQKDLYKRGNAMQTEEPVLDVIEGEISMDISAEVREELFHVVERDGSFGYLFYILGTEQNSRRNSEPIDCIPNEERIIQCLIDNRDDYPKSSLDDYINENINYQQYNLLVDGHYWEDNDAEYLKYFNRVYEIFDELRLRKQSISRVKEYIKDQMFDCEAKKYWTFQFIIQLIDKSNNCDECLDRCKLELDRIIAPLKEQFVSRVNEVCQSPICLSERRGIKIDIIRVLNVLYELAVFTGKDGKPISKKEYMTAMGKFLNVDLSNYDKDLSRALSDGTALDKHLRIFNDMLQKMTEIFNRH